VSLYQGNIYELLSVCHAAMVTSGTATLETALMGVPMVVAYKLSILSYWLGRLLIDVPFISLANLVAGEKVVTELIQKDVTPEKIAEEILVVLEDQKARDVMISKMGTMRNRLGGGGATERTAKIAVDMIETE
jgi:lipid-A-disaccharide synthase